MNMMISEKESNKQPSIATDRKSYSKMQTRKNDVNSIKNRRGSNENSLDVSNLIDVYWSFFQLHSKQRMKILDMFIKVQLGLYAAYYALGSQFNNLRYMCAVAIAIVSLLCYFLDKRTTDLIHSARLVFRKIEKKYMRGYPKEMKLFTSVKNSEGIINYSRIIRLAYLLSFIVGIILLLVALKYQMASDNFSISDVISDLSSASLY